MALEIQLERDLVRPNPPEVERLDSERSRGASVAFLSDMYLPSWAVETMLNDHGLLEEGDRVWVSADVGASKRSGDLFAVAAREMGDHTARRIHRGNAPVADVECARRAGWNSEHASAGNPLPDEARLGSFSHETAGLSAVLAGASRLARLRIESTSKHEVLLRDTAATIAGPAVVAYCLWVLSEAKRAGTSRLYFLAREGWLLLEVSRLLSEKLPWSPELRYLHCSRSALNLTAVTETDSVSLAWLLTGASAMPARDVLSRVGLDGETETALFRRLVPSWNGLDSPLSASALEEVCNAMSKDPWRSKILSSAETRRGLVGAYLEQEGVFDDEYIGIVDTNGVGSQIWALGELRRARGLSAPLGFHVGRTKNTLVGKAAHDGRPNLRAWLGDAGRDVGWFQDSGGWVLWEMFCTAPHGSVRSYEEQVYATVTPIVVPLSVEQEDWGSSLVRNTVLEVARQMHLDAGDVDPEADLRHQISAGLKRLWTRPSSDEARAWGSFPLGVRDAGHAVEVGPPYRLRDILPHWLRMVDRSRRQSHWQVGAERASRRDVRVLLRARRKIHRAYASIGRR